MTAQSPRSHKALGTAEAVLERFIPGTYQLNLRDLADLSHHSHQLAEQDKVTDPGEGGADAAGVGGGRVR